MTHTLMTRFAKNQLGQAVLLAVLAGTVGGAHAADSKASKYYEDALVRFEKKDMNGAIIQLKNALQIDKNMLPVQVLLGKALLKNGDAVAAEVAFIEAIRIGVNRAEVIIPLAQAYMAQGKQKLLLEQQQFAVAGLPTAIQGQLLLVRATASTDLGDVRAALKAIDEARAIDAKSPDSWLAEVPVRIRTRQFAEASSAAERALALAPGSADAWYQKGSVLHVSGGSRDAVGSYDQALKADALHIEARVARAGLHIDLAQYAEAAKDVAELQRLFPKEPRAAYLRALLAEHGKQPDAARNALKQVTSLLDPVPIDFVRYRPQLLMLNGLAHFGLNEREKAKQYLEAFQRIQGNTAVSKLLAKIYMGDANVDKAVEVLEGYLKTQPADGQAMMLLGSALLSKGQHARAVSLMQQALQAKDAPEYRTVLGLSLLRGGQTDNAVKELETAFKKDPLQTQAAMALIEVYMRGGQAMKAVSIAEELVRQQPANGEFMNLLGITRGKAGNVASAKSAFEQAIKLSEPSMVPKLNLARLEISAKAYDAAAQRLDAILKTDEKNAEAMYEMAILSDRKGLAADTQRWLEKANDQAGPREPRWGLALSEFHLRNNRPGPALEAAKRASAKSPDDFSVLLAYARAQLALGDTPGAKSTLTNATRVADYNPPLQVQIAQLQLAANNVAGAAYSLEKALSSQPDFLPAVALMANVELREGNTAKAEKTARKIAEQNPKLAVGYSLLGDVALARGQSSQALDNYRRAYQAEPSTETLLKLFRNLSLQDNGNSGKAARQLADQWLALYPKDIAVQSAVADSHAANGNFAVARASYENILKNSPNDINVLNNLANVLLSLKDPAAVKVAEQALSKDPKNPNVIDTLGWTLFQFGQTDRALQLLRDARLRDPGNAVMRYHLAVVLAQTGRRTEAKDELELALKGGRTFENATDAEALLKTLK